MRGKEHKQPQTKQNTKQKPQPGTKKHTQGQRPFLPRLKVFPLYQGETCEKDCELPRGLNYCESRTAWSAHERSAAKPIKGASLILVQRSQFLLSLSSHGKSSSRCTTLSTDCTTKTRGMSIVRQWRQRQRKGYADDGDAIPPRRKVTIAPLSRHGVPLGYSLFQKRERH